AAAPDGSAVQVSPMTRGPGLVPSTSGWAASLAVNRFASEPAAAAGHLYGATLADAVASNQYYQFTVAPPSGGTLTLTGLSFLAFFQGGVGGAGIAYSTDGTHFGAAIPASGSASQPATPWTVDLSGRADLRNVAGPVVVRIYLFGLGSWMCSGL